ncbi:MAG: hypothetical protein AAGD01_19890 [Acidobacteriota bacterium]
MNQVIPLNPEARAADYAADRAAPKARACRRRRSEAPIFTPQLKSQVLNDLAEPLKNQLETGRRYRPAEDAP